MTEDRHERQHEYLAASAETIERIRQHSYERAKAQHVHAPRQFANRSVRSHRVSLVAGWRAHLRAFHGQTRLGPFLSLDELTEMHDRLHKGSE
jgi:hypothetical protein